MRPQSCPCLQAHPSQDVAAGYLDSLSSTEAVLSALRQAHRAKLAIHRGSVPTAHETVAYADPSHRMQGSVWTSLSCQRMALSPCGNWLAVTFMGQVLEETSDRTDSGQAASGEDSLYETCGLVVYSMSDMSNEVYRHCSIEAPVLCWAASAPHLSIASPHDPAGTLYECEHPCINVFVLDCQTKTILCSLTPQIWEMVKYEGQGCQHLAWCSEGRRLLTFPGIDQLTEHNIGYLQVPDVWENSVLGGSWFAVERPILGTLAAAWHPKAMIIVLSYGVVLQQAHNFAATGIVFTTLPKFCRLEDQLGMGF